MRYSVFPLTAQSGLDETPSLIQCLVSRHSLGFEDEELGSSPGWWAATVATRGTTQILIYES